MNWFHSPRPKHSGLSVTSSMAISARKRMPRTPSNMTTNLANTQQILRLYYYTKPAQKRQFLNKQSGLSITKCVNDYCSFIFCSSSGYTYRGKKLGGGGARKWCHYDKLPTIILQTVQVSNIYLRYFLHGPKKWPTKIFLRKLHDKYQWTRSEYVSYGWCRMGREMVARCHSLMPEPTGGPRFFQ